MGANASRVETWTLYSIGSLTIFARIGCRWRMVGVSGFKPDDYIIFLSWVSHCRYVFPKVKLIMGNCKATYTTMTYAADVVGGLGDLHALPLDQRKALSENLSGKEAQSYIYGTQWFCAGVAVYISFIWTLKLNMLFLFQRVVRGLWVERFIKPTMILVVATYLGIIIALFGACRPYHRMWTIYPDQGPYCQPQSVLNMALPLALNLLTDLIIATIPSPVILKAHNVSVLKRICLFILFGAVSFIMIAAILRVVFVLLYKSGPVAAIWSCREDIVAILVGQAFLIRPMFSKSFWTKKNRSDAHSQECSKDIEKSDGNSCKKSKWKDPFSLTAALATVTEDTEPITSKSFAHSGSDDLSIDRVSVVQSQSISSPIGIDVEKTRSSNDMVIHVSQHVSIENVEIDQKSPQRVYHPNDTWQPTNSARAWNQSQV
ncbi:hypothetical protein F4680DRAFT_449290 [Xylaria scruposa]|nr:hypothetical protein F4680DRAFT_449290 [Xylaria scruposa]